MTDIEKRLIDIEVAITNQDKVIEDLNQVVILQGKQIDNLLRQNQYLLSILENDTVKPQNEETPPPHYQPLVFARKRHIYVVITDKEMRL